MAESKGWAQALRRVTRGGADWTSSPGKGFSNMRDWAATGEVYFTSGHLRGGRKKDNAETQRALRLAEKKGTGRSACPTMLLFGGVGFGCGVGVFVLEALDAAGGVD